MMRSQTRLLIALLISVAGLAVWSETGFTLGRSQPQRFVSSGAVPCPPGFVPESQSLLLPEVPPGQFRPAQRQPIELQCVVLAAPPVR